MGDHYGELLFCLLWLTLWLWDEPEIFLGWLWSTLMTSLVYLTPWLPDYLTPWLPDSLTSLISIVPSQPTLWIWNQPKVFLGWLWCTLMTFLVYLGYPVLQVSGQEPSMSSKYPMKDTLSWQPSVCSDWLCGYGTSLKYFWGDSGVIWCPVWYVFGILSSKSLVRIPQCPQSLLLCSPIEIASFLFVAAF